MLFSKTRHLHGKGLFQPQGLGLTVSLDRGRVAFVRESVHAVLFAPLESTSPLDGGRRGARHGGRDQSELHIVKACLLAGPVGYGIVNLGVGAMDCGRSPMNLVSEEVPVLVVIIVINRRGKDAIDSIKDLAEGVGDGIGLHVAIAFREGERIEMVGGPSFVVRRKESFNLLEVDKGARLLKSGWDSTTDSKPVAVIDGDCVSVDLVTQVDMDSRRIAGRSVKEFVIYVVQTGAVNPPPSLDFFEPADQMIQRVGGWSAESETSVRHWRLT